MYHARLGRFISRDPIGYVPGMGLYEYVGSAPCRSGDAFGLVNGGSSPTMGPWSDLNKPKPYTIDKDCCCKIRSYIIGQYGAWKRAYSMLENYEAGSGKGALDYDVVAESDLSGYRGLSFWKAPKCVREVSERMYGDPSLIARAFFHQWVLGTAGIFNPFFWIFEEDDYLTIFWFYWVGEEIRRTRDRIAMLKKVQSECQKKFGPSKEKYDRWIDLSCEEKENLARGVCREWRNKKGVVTLKMIYYLRPKQEDPFLGRGTLVHRRHFVPKKSTSRPTSGSK